jgi:hypothetical protein
MCIDQMQEYIAQGGNTKAGYAKKNHPTQSELQNNVEQWILCKQTTGPENPKAKRHQTNRINVWWVAPPFLPLPPIF